MRARLRAVLDLDLELRATARFGSRIVGGRRGGRIGPGETVTSRLRQFGIPAPAHLGDQ